MKFSLIRPSRVLKHLKYYKDYIHFSSEKFIGTLTLSNLTVSHFFTDMGRFVKAVR